MKQIFFATTNKGKVNSIASVLSKFDTEVIQKPLEIPEIRSENLKDIAIHKFFTHLKISKSQLWPSMQVFMSIR